VKVEVQGLTTIICMRNLNPEKS